MNVSPLQIDARRRAAHRASARRAAGFTFAEVLVAVAIVGIVASIGIPMLTAFTREAGVSTQADALLQGLQITRTEAVKRNTRVTMCRSTSGTGCSGSGNWIDGWIVFVDGGTSGTRDTDDEILQVQPQLKSKGEIRGTTDVASYVSYVSNGQPRKTDNTVQEGSLSICSGNAGDKRRRISLVAGTGWAGVNVIAGSTTCAS